jgi:hypothetical protein
MPVRNNQTQWFQTFFVSCPALAYNITLYGLKSLLTEESSIPSTINIVHFNCKIKENKERGIKLQGGGRKRRRNKGK